MSQLYRLSKNQMVRITESDQFQDERNVSIGNGCFLLVVDEIRIAMAKRATEDSATSIPEFIIGAFETYLQTIEKFYPILPSIDDPPLREHTIEEFPNDC